MDETMTQKDLEVGDAVEITEGCEPYFKTGDIVKITKLAEDGIWCEGDFTGNEKYH